MSIANKPINMTGFVFGTGDENLLQVSVEKSFTTQIDIVSGSGVLEDIVYGGEEHKITATKVSGAGSTAPAMGAAFSAGGATGFVSKVSTLKSNEDVEKFQIEAIGFPAISGGGSGGN
jgi:hypothetical protein